MKFFTFLAIVKLALSSSYRQGAMYISRIEGTHTHQGLEANGIQVFASNERSHFEYYKNGTLKLSQGDKFLCLDDLRKLVLAESPCSSFALIDIEGLTTMKSVHFNGSKVFEIFEDHSIGYQSNCDGAAKALITFEDSFVPKVEISSTNFTAV